MRNRLLTWGLLAVLIVMSLALGGCGSHAAPGSKSTAIFDPAVARADTPEAIDAELAARFEKTKKAADKMFAEEAGHLVITHKYGKTILPEHPQRIAVIGLEDTAVSLDIPIAAAHLTKSSYLYPLMKDKGIADIPINAETKTINLEAVQQAKPDLILMRDSYDKNAYNALSKIAPVVALDLQKEEVTALAAARAVGQEEKGEARLHAYYGCAKQARMAIKGNIGDATVAFLRVAEGDPPLSVFGQCDEPLHVRALEPQAGPDGRRARQDEEQPRHLDGVPAGPAGRLPRHLERLRRKQRRQQRGGRQALRGTAERPALADPAGCAGRTHARRQFHHLECARAHRERNGHPGPRGLAWL